MFIPMGGKKSDKKIVGVVMPASAVKLAPPPVEQPGDAEMMEGLRAYSSPLGRDDYESACRELGAEAMADAEISRSYGVKHGVFTTASYPAKEVAKMTLAALRWRAIEAELEARVSSEPNSPRPVAMQGQIWDQCESCGAEPSYLPLHLCEKCWPTPQTEDGASAGEIEKFAVYQSEGILSVGGTIEDAIAEIGESMDSVVPFSSGIRPDSYDQGTIVDLTGTRRLSGDSEACSGSSARIRRITARLAAQIESEGGNIAFEIRDDGVLDVWED